MKKALLLMTIFTLVLGCAGTPMRNPQFTESSLPRQYNIEGVKPIKSDPESIGGNPGFSYWVTCVDMVLNFYGRPLDKETKDKAITRVRIRNTAVAVGAATISTVGAVTIPTAVFTATAASAGAVAVGAATRPPISPVAYYPTALRLLGFKRHHLYDQSPDGTMIKFSLAQGHPVIVGQWFLGYDYAPTPLTDRDGWGKITIMLLIGYDDEKEVFLACDPKVGEAIEIPYKDFPRRRAFEWADTDKLIRSAEIIYPEK